MIHDNDDEEDKTSIGDVRSILAAVAQREDAYLIVIAGQNTGEMFKVNSDLYIGRGKEVEVRLTDTETSRRHAKLFRTSDGVYVEDLDSTNGTFVNGEKISRQVLADGDKIQVGTNTILKFSYHDDIDEEFQRKMFDAALRDSLTQAFNRKYFSERLTSEFAFSQRHGTPLSLLLFDLDHFKKVNDTYGHLGGDYVLVALAKQVCIAIRREDIFARYGGEEFAVLCRGINRAGTERLAERIRIAIETFSFEHDGRRIPVTISVGVAMVPAKGIDDSTALVEAADKALYTAKRLGRNRFHVFDESVSFETRRPD